MHLAGGEDHRIARPEPHLATPVVEEPFALQHVIDLVGRRARMHRRGLPRLPARHADRAIWRLGQKLVDMVVRRELLLLPQIEDVHAGPPFVRRRTIPNMEMANIPFGTTDWSAVERTVHPGETGTATWRTRTFDGIRVRMV